MTALPESGDPGNEFEKLKLDQLKPQELTELTWSHLLERYKYLREFKKGGQARVFHMKERTGAQRDVAIKVYHENTTKSAKAFDNEIRWLGSRNLPEDVVVDLYDGNPPPGLQPYLVLELIDNAKEIHEYAESPRPMTMPQRIDLFEKYLRTLHRFHDCGVVIGDVSSRNVLVQPGDRIRFIDLAGAKPLWRGRTGSQSSINMGTPGNVPAAVLTGDMSTSRVTDLIGAANVGVQILTGRSWNELLVEARLIIAEGTGDLQHPQAMAICERQLVRRDVPPSVQQVLLKGLRQPDERLKPDPDVYVTALGMADDIAAWRQSVMARQQRVERWRHGLMVAALLLLVALPGAFFWFKWDEARQASELVASRRMISELQQEVGKLVTHVAVDQLRQAAGTALQQLDDAQARGEPLAKSLKLADEARSTLRRAIDVGREIGSATELRTAIGSILLENRSPVASEFWTTGAPTIRTRLTALQARYTKLGQRIKAGDVGAAETSLLTELTKLLADLKQLVIDNGHARTALLAKREYEREKGTVADRIQDLGEFKQINKRATDGEQEFVLGQFDAAKTDFGNATTSLIEYIQRPGTETTDETKDRQRKTVDLVKVLEADKANLQSRVAQLNGDVQAKLKQVSDLQTQFTQLSAKQLKDQEARTVAERKLSDAEPKLAELNQTKASLTMATTDFDAANKTLSSQTKKLEDIEPKLAQAERDRDQWKTRAEGAEKLLTTLPVSNQQSGNADRKSIGDSSQVAAAIEARLKSLDSPDREAAQKLLIEAVQAWAKDDQQLASLKNARVELLKTVAETGDEVVKLDAEIRAHRASATRPEARAAAKRLDASVRAAAAKVDAADERRFNEIEVGISELEKLLKELTNPMGGRKLLANHPEVITLKHQIGIQLEQQAPYVAGAARAAGKGKTLPLSMAAAGRVISSVDPIHPKAAIERTLKVGGIAMDFVWIRRPAAKFKMGDAVDEPLRPSNNTQVDAMLTSGYWMLTTEVTDAMYAANAPFDKPLYTAIAEAKAAFADIGEKVSNEPMTVPDPRWAQQWCQVATTEAHHNGMLSSKERFALPTEAQWEYAARAGTTTAYFFGSDATQLPQYAWYGASTSQNVGQKKPNPWGLFDIAGNVSEWCSDGYTETLPGGTDPIVPPSVFDFVSRGGSFKDKHPARLRVGNRKSHYSHSLDLVNDVGFRVVITRE